MKAKTWVLTLAAVALIAAATSAAFNLNPGTWLAKETASAQSPSKPVVGADQPPPQPIPPGTMPNYRAIVQQSAPAVIGVTVAGQHSVGPDESPMDLNDPFFQFFRGLPGFQLRIPRPGQGNNVPFRSQGSGFIIASDGLILTNAHVVREAREVSVKLNDRREFQAKVLGSDPATDIAVLRIDARNLPVVRLSDAQQLQVGDPVLAIGSPFGFEQSATQGIVSAKGRSLPGNSGGPLFDGSGAVVGINAQIYSQSGGFQGLSFAIPINVALKVKDQIVANGHASHARLGVTVQDLTHGLAESFGLSRPSGALIASVAPNGAAALAGLMPGDVITEINGEVIDRSGDLSSRISQETPGSTVRLKVWRDKSAREVSVKLGRAQDRASTKARSDDDVKAGKLGLGLRALTRDEQSKAHVQGGLLIEGVAGPAARAGLVPGDVLLAINGVAVNSVEQVRRLMDSQPRSVALLILHEGERLFVPMELK